MGVESSVASFTRNTRATLLPMGPSLVSRSLILIICSRRPLDPVKFLQFRPRSPTHVPASHLHCSSSVQLDVHRSGVRGMIVAQDDTGLLACLYLGTDPKMKVSVASTARELDYEVCVYVRVCVCLYSARVFSQRLATQESLTAGTLENQKCPIYDTLTIYLLRSYSSLFQKRRVCVCVCVCVRVCVCLANVYCACACPRSPTMVTTSTSYGRPSANACALCIPVDPYLDLSSEPLEAALSTLNRIVLRLPTPRTLIETTALESPALTPAHRRRWIGN